jgi:hypothetical protein
MTDEAKTYKTAGAFRTALETRLQNRARAEGTDLQRLRRQVAFDRFLARMFSNGPKATYVRDGRFACQELASSLTMIRRRVAFKGRKRTTARAAGSNRVLSVLSRAS